MSKQRSSFPFVLTLIAAGAFGLSGFAQTVSFEGSPLHVIEDTPDKNTGLDKIFVVYDTRGVDLEFSCANPSAVKIYKYGNLGGGYAEEITNIIKGQDRVIIRDIEGNYGYIIDTQDKRYYYWVVNYLPYRLALNSVEVSDDSDCGATVLNIDGSGAPIHYYTINGQQRVLDRNIKVIFESQEFNSSSLSFENIPVEFLVASFDHQIRVSSPSLCHTSYIVTGDRFLEEWNWMEEAESIVVAPKAVAVETEALSDNISTSTDSDSDLNDGEDTDDESKSEGSNQIKGDDSALGGSAPADIEFKAYVSEGVIHYEWQMSHDPEFEEIDYRFNVKDLDYTFLEEGTYYLRFIGSNSDGSCEAIGETFTVTIGASELLCPNAFSPDGDGVNDEWKVSYRSIIDFDCWIFDRYGAEIFHFSDPSLGWDGKHHGKLVKPGVYYYVITATGADGRKYKKSGDINILRKRNNSGYSNDTTGE